MGRFLALHPAVLEAERRREESAASAAAAHPGSSRLLRSGCSGWARQGDLAAFGGEGRMGRAATPAPGAPKPFPCAKQRLLGLL